MMEGHSKTTAQTPTTGAYYAKDDYAGLWKRIAAWVIDIFIICLISFGYWIIFNYYITQWTDIEIHLLAGLSFITVFIYLVFVKNSEVSTIGFFLTKTKVVDLHGERPSSFKMALRFLLLSIGPFQLIPDLLWLTGEETKQTLRDKFAGTYVVKRKAIPRGFGKIVPIRLYFLGYNMQYNEVEIPKLPHQM